jgi:hypothetical protein
MTQEVTHSQIYKRLLAVEFKIDIKHKNTSGLVEAINALDGATRAISATKIRKELGIEPQ